jgi:ribonucleoside-triphosphate reductase
VLSKIEIPCEVYSRVSGYFRPVKQWNPGKQSEFNDRISYKLPEAKNEQEIRRD